MAATAPIGFPCATCAFVRPARRFTGAPGPLPSMRRTQQLQSTYCSRLTHGSIALIGDAAHSMWASLGQGVNAALGEQRWLVIFASASDCLRYLAHKGNPAFHYFKRVQYVIWSVNTIGLRSFGKTYPSVCPFVTQVQLRCFSLQYVWYISDTWPSSQTCDQL